MENLIEIFVYVFGNLSYLIQFYKIFRDYF